MTTRLLFPLIVLLLLMALAGCRAAECKQMLDCCEQVEDLEGLGGGCADLAEGTRDPQTCRDVLRTVGYMLEDRDDSIPEACSL